MCAIISKTYVAIKASFNKAGEPIRVSRWWRYYEFYVDPGDGILKRAKNHTDKARKRAKEQRRQRLAREQSQVSRINLAPGSDLRQLSGIWFAVNYTVAPDGNELIKQSGSFPAKSYANVIWSVEHTNRQIPDRRDSGVGRQLTWIIPARDDRGATIPE